MDIGHFCEHVNSMTTALEAHVIIVPEQIHHVSKAYKVCEDSEFRYQLTDIERKVLCEEVGFRNYTENDLMNDALAE